MRPLKSLIIGKGQIGTSLYNVLKGVHDVCIQDKEMEYGGEFDIVHICFPYSKDFVGDVKDYQDIYRAKYVVIHSTVPVGTSHECWAFHSPVTGKHPYLEQSLKTFIKYLAPKSAVLKKYFEKAGIPIKLIKKPEETEAMKIWATTRYGLSIILEKEIYKYCKENKLDFKTVYTDAIKDYNEGYTKVGEKQYIHPTIGHQEGKIGGHCVLQNCDLLDHKITRFIKNANKDY